MRSERLVFVFWAVVAVILASAVVCGAQERDRDEAAIDAALSIIYQAPVRGGWIVDRHGTGRFRLFPVTEAARREAAEAPRRAAAWVPPMPPKGRVMRASTELGRPTDRYLGE